MKLTVYHDENGKLVSVSARPKGAPPSRMELRPAPVRSEIDAPDLPEDASPDAIQEYLANALANRRVEFEQGSARLISTD